MNKTHADDDPFAIYDDLLAPLVAAHGALDDEVLSSPLMMFGVSFLRRAADGLYVVYEPSHLEETESREGLRFALFVAAKAPEEALTDLLTAIADYVLDHEIGDGDTLDLAALEIDGLPSTEARFRLFSRAPEGYGLYELRFEA
ncbi:MAG: hypothetical protein AAFZ09_14045 [Pseudomonadota bacterium]